MTKINILEFSQINILLLIFVILIIYGYFFALKNKQIINIFENFTDQLNEISSEYDLVDIESDIENIKDNSDIVMERMRNYANGNWLTNESEIKNGVVNNLMKINIIGSSGNVNYMNENLKISNIAEGLVYTDVGTSGNYLTIKFLNYTNGTNLNLPYEAIRGLPRCVVYSFNNINDTSNKFISLKLVDGTNESEIDPEIKRIIKYKIFDNNIPYLDYDTFSYKKIIGNYIFPKNSIQAEKYSGTLSQSNIDKYNTFYSGGVPFSIKRTYLTANDKYVSTKISQKFFIKAYDGDQKLSAIKLMNPSGEMKYNKISEEFKPYSVTIYIYILKNYDISYNFGDQNYISSSYSWGSTNGLQNNFASNSKLLINPINRLQKVNNSTYKLFKLGTYFYTGSSDNIVNISLPF